MKKRVLIAILATLTIPNITTAATPTTGPAHDAAVADNAFAMDVYAQLRQKEGNICVSPYSLATALDMVSAGAKGQTQTQMLAALHWSNPVGDLPAAASALSSGMLKQDRNDKRAALIEIADALFGQSGYPYRPEFLDLVTNQYAASLQPVDFLQHSADALTQINKWAAEKTHDKIKQALPAQAITPLTRLVLVNAVYFKGQWLEDFQKAQTTDQPFHLNADKSVNVSLMQRQATFDYMENDQLQAVELRYHGDFSMTILLPRKTEGLPGLEESLTSQSMGLIDDALKNETVEVSLPRFRMECSYDLNETLSKLGMTDAFDPAKADFSGIASLEKLEIDKVQQKTFIAVDEQGTEAAAVSSVRVGVAAMAPRRKPFTFRADHPFIFVLKQRSTGAILFIGRYENPA